MSSSSVILNSTSETDKPPVIRVNARRRQCDNLSKPSSDSKSSMGQLQNGHLTSEEAETVRQKSDCRISLTDGAFADFLERMKRRLVRGNAKDYEVPSVAPKSDPDSPPRRPVTRSLCKGKCLDQSSALPKKLAKTSKSTAQQVDWTRYGVVIRSAEFGDLTVCTLCGENSFPFMCIDGFRKHLEVFHSSETQ
ncbi:hypothetical protein TTRE_0000736701 [Trichuris trichiura]|uniref:Uncharacterized protein n=1 Tax=Trichuris trichiura TaxID=36087 RepID=A0A077ZF62_TRITR|nr:hypothetical protein TTRE_0000736701 [Trichuris trichiura]